MKWVLFAYAETTQLNLAYNRRYIGNSFEKLNNQRTIQVNTSSHNGLYDITRQVETIIQQDGVQSGLVNVYAQGANNAIMIEFHMMNPLSGEKKYNIRNPKVVPGCREFI